MLNNLIPFFDANDGTTMATTNTVGTISTGAYSTPANIAFQPSEIVATPEDAPKADEPETGVDVKAEAQKIADAMVARKMKNMPSKEELKAFHEWQEAQKTEAEKYADIKADADRRVKEAEAKSNKADAYIYASKAGIKAEHIDDAVILAMAKVNDDTTIEEAILKVAETNPAWKAGTNLGSTGGNPPTDQDEKNMEIRTFI